jgi:hypothetical protein
MKVMLPCSMWDDDDDDDDDDNNNNNCIVINSLKLFISGHQ